MIGEPETQSLRIRGDGFHLRTLANKIKRQKGIEDETSEESAVRRG
jgi:hypothetical protein